MNDQDNSPTSIRVIDYSTGDAPRKKVKPRPFIVKVSLPGKTTETIPQARIRSKDGKVDTRGPARLLERRFRKGEREGYFFATLDSEQLEIGDRAPTPVKGEDW
jgi:hypothetical protein